MCVSTQAQDVSKHTGTGCVLAHRHWMCVGTQAQDVCGHTGTGCVLAHRHRKKAQHTGLGVYQITEYDAV